MDIETVRAQIEKYLGKPVDQLYASFDEKPIGSASIAQVHRATLLDGTVVAAVTIVFRAIGFVGIIISLFFAQRLYREMKKGK